MLYPHVLTIGDTASSEALIALLGVHPGGPVEHPFDVHASLESRDGHEQIALQVVPVAPGVARLVPEHKPRIDGWNIIGLPQHDIFVNIVDPVSSTPAVATPVLDTMVLTSHVESAGNPDAETNTRLLMKLKSPIPEGVVGVIVVDETGHAMSFTEVVAREDELYILETGRHCPPPKPPGWTVPVVGQRIEIEWLDFSGHVSPPSNLVTVGFATE